MSSKAFIIPLPQAKSKKATVVVKSKTPADGNNVKPTETTAKSTESTPKDSKNKPENKSENTKVKPQSNAQKTSWWQKINLDSLPTNLLISLEKTWHEQTYNKPIEGNISSYYIKDDRLLRDITHKLASLYNNELQIYQNEMLKLGVSSDQKWLNSVIKTGTWSDKIAALALKVSESPFHNLEALDLLIGIIEKKDLRVAFLGIDALKDLLVNNILPDRPLLEFKQLPLLITSLSMTQALIYYYENEIKSRIARVIHVLEISLQSNVAHFRKQGLEMIYEMLVSKPEQESKLLSMLVSRLNDNDGKITSKTIELLKKLIYKHPAMQMVIIREVKILLYKPTTKISTILTGIHFFTRMDIAKQSNAQEIAVSLLECYFSFFEKALQAKDEGSRLLSMLLMGINRAFPCLTSISESLFQYLDTIFTLVHTANSFSTATQALVFLSHLITLPLDTTTTSVDTSNTPTTTTNTTNTTTNRKEKIDLQHLQNRFYRALYSKLISDQALSHAKNSMFLNLLYRSIKADKNLGRAKSFLKRLALVATQTSPPIAAGFLYMISEILSHRKDLLILITEPETILDASLNPQSETSPDGDDDVHSIEQSMSGPSAAYQLLGCYDANKREPEYACLFTTMNSHSHESKTIEGIPSLYELALLRHHYHPSVKAFAQALLEPPNHGISFNGDPLTEFNLMSFLNRFAYKNPKQQITERLKKSHTEEQHEEPINLQFSSGAVDFSNGVAPDKIFFYKYFGERDSLRSIGKSRERKQKEKDNSDGEDDSDVDEEEELDRYADQLAQDMMRHDSATRHEDLEEFSEDDDDDDDDDDFDVDAPADGDEDDDDDIDGEEDDEEDDEDMDIEEPEAYVDDEEEEGEEVEDEEDIDDEDLEGEEFDEDEEDLEEDEEEDDDDGEGSLVAEEFDDEDDVEVPGNWKNEIQDLLKELQQHHKPTKKQDKKSLVEEAPVKTTTKPTATKAKADTKAKVDTKTTTKQSKKGKKEEDFPEPEAYVSEDDDEDMDFTMNQKKKKATKQTKRKQNYGDDDDLAFVDDEDFDDYEMQERKGSKSQDVFADADDYLEEMDEIVKTHSLLASKETTNDKKNKNNQKNNKNTNANNHNNNKNNNNNKKPRRN